MYINIYIYIHICVYTQQIHKCIHTNIYIYKVKTMYTYPGMCIYIYIYTEGERVRERDGERKSQLTQM